MKKRRLKLVEEIREAKKSWNLLCKQKVMKERKKGLVAAREGDTDCKGWLSRLTAAINANHIATGVS